MPCTTILVGKLASNDGSTMIARTDDGHFDDKKLVVIKPKDQPKTYRSVISHVEIKLPPKPLRYTSCPSVNPEHGIWPATGINAANVGMTATETISSNPRVLGADPLVVLKKAEREGDKEIPGGIGEEDIVTLVLPYIRSAREGVVRLGSLLEQYGTYESNGIAFNDENEIWWLETIGGHHWIARRVGDDEVVVMPNQFGLDNFDFDDAYGEQSCCMCSKDLKEFLEQNRLDLNRDGVFNPRWAFGSHAFHDHIYNTPCAWYMGRYLTPTRYRWDGPDADFTPESDNIPWSFVPEKKVTVEDVAFLLSSHYQGTPYDPYASSAEKPGIYRPIGINRTGVTGLCQIRSGVPDAVKGVEWICFASTTFGAFLPVYVNVPKMPDYLSAVTKRVSTEDYYWTTRMIGALADASYGGSIMHIERYQNAIACKSRALLNEYDRKIAEGGGEALLQEANDKLCEMAKEETDACLSRVLRAACERMRNGYKRSDN